VDERNDSPASDDDKDDTDDPESAQIVSESEAEKEDFETKGMLFVSYKFGRGPRIVRR
jgi:hypothetical protein